MSKISSTHQQLPLPVVGSTVFGRYPKISVEQTFNMIISDNMLVPFAGYQSVATIVGDGTGRALYTSNNYGQMIGIVNDGVFTINNNLSFTRVGTLDTSTGISTIAENNGSQIAISTGKSIYIFDYVNNTFAPATSPNGTPLNFLPGYVSFQNTYFIASDTNSNNWYLSQNNNGLIFPQDASTTGTLQTKADKLVAAVPFPGKGNLLVVFGKTVCEFWYDLGYQLFPYQRSSFYNMNYGCLSAQTIATEDNLLAWLSGNEQSGPTIMITQGGMPEKLSTDGIDFRLANLTNPSNSFAFFFRQDGHLFYQITFPDDNATYAYDFNTKKFFTLSDKDMNYHIAKRVAYYNGNYYFLSASDGNLYQTSSNITTYNGDVIPRVRELATFRLPNSRRFVVNSLSFPIEQGVSPNPQAVEFSFSRNGGKSFSNYYRKVLNPQGYSSNRFQYYLGSTMNEFTPQFRFWGDNRFVVGNGTMEVYQ